MYRVSALLDGKEYALEDPRTQDERMAECKLSLELNKTGTLTCILPHSHPNADKILPMISEIAAYQDDDLLYCGRPSGSTADFENTGVITCEGELSYLLDSMVRPFEQTGSIYNTFKFFLDSHNAQVEPKKRFELGIVSVVDSNNYINRSNSDYSRTLDAINDKLIQTHGGYLKVRRENGKRYLDYLSDYGHINSQIIEFRENLLSLDKYIQSDELITVVFPQGAQTEEDGINGTKKRVDITSVNNGKDHLVDSAAYGIYGWIAGQVSFDDITIPSNLKKKAQAYLDEHKNLALSLEITAVDLHLIDVTIEAFQVGDWVRVRSEPHGLDQLFLVTKLELDLSQPGNSVLTLGKSLDTFTSDSNKQQGEITEYVKQTAKETGEALQDVIEEKVENATQLITGGLGGYVVLDMGTGGLPQRILVMDTPDKNSSKNIVQINKNGIGFSTAGINGPYRNAWTIDGNLVADFITTGTLNASLLRAGTINADLIKTGVLQSRNGASKIDMDTGIAALQGNFTVVSAQGDAIGGIKYDTNGAGTPSEAKNRMYIHTQSGFAMKLQSSGSMSFESGGQIYMRASNGMLFNVNGSRWEFTNEGLYLNGKKMLPVVLPPPCNCPPPEGGT